MCAILTERVGDTQKILTERVGDTQKILTEYAARRIREPAEHWGQITSGRHRILPGITRAAGSLDSPDRATTLPPQECSSRTRGHDARESATADTHGSDACYPHHGVYHRLTSKHQRPTPHHDHDLRHHPQVVGWTRRDSLSWEEGDVMEIRRIPSHPHPCFL